MEPQNYEYIRLYTLVTTAAAAVVLTIAAVVYAISSGVSASDAQGIVDQAVLRGDMTLCASAPAVAQKSCYQSAFPVVATAETCPRIPLLDVKNTCEQYFAKLAAFAPTAEQHRKPFTYEQLTLEVTFTDGFIKRFKALVADTDEKRTQGLSYVPAMLDDEAMLFVFTPGLPEMAFHMKDMLLPLDIIFLTKDLTPVQSFRNLPSCLGLEVCPLQTRKGGDVQYVLEVLPQGREMLGIRLLGGDSAL